MCVFFEQTNITQKCLIGCNGDGPDLGLNWTDCKFKLWKWVKPKVLGIQKISLKIGSKVLSKKKKRGGLKLRLEVLFEMKSWTTLVWTCHKVVKSLGHNEWCYFELKIS